MWNWFSNIKCHGKLWKSQVEVPFGSDFWSDAIPTHMVCFSRTKLQGSGAHNSMVRGHFPMVVVWSEVICVWDSLIRGALSNALKYDQYDQRSLRSGDDLIRGHFEITPLKLGYIHWLRGCFRQSSSSS